MDVTYIKHRLDLYVGSIQYGVGNCKNAYAYLKQKNDELNEAWRNGTTHSLNELGHLDKVFKDYLILKIAGLFDKRGDTLSLFSLQKFLQNNLPDSEGLFAPGFVEIQNKYQDTIKKVVKVRHKAVAHTSDDFPDNILYTQDLLAMPIMEFLKDVENLAAQVGTITFPVR
ncbi:MAG: hypothetical protein A3D92_21395 [Bacteroidetes bacterium RIFCSPHIGHO2_02_FULL_44_7]|uniref:RiboL-PSP-HEPN domain-containing protein n=1 Tax=Candidatus Jorgensenbacteria bacterium RIFCSPLOWO2_01_FULL_45_25b TaxID=1798471 RepID=A0A1F6BRX6_9BACT|nr:MAG: hypothetical protein A3D92_21395 [Bacteroidetes bacterium RIFCSPHIGHO2_02_FULL_44_7]OGG39684.1 MAG: hypothetical protein A3A21_00065 [Candidatus Jorgensenbacteria bacterium RIFCSPLOWO2_01_FULL_45_25b]